MSFAGFVAHHGRSITFAAIALTIAGLASALSLPVGLFPQVSFPRIVVDLDAGSRPADQTALLVTRPTEEVIRTVPGVQDVRSASTRGAAQISIDFGWGRDMVSSMLLVDAAIARIIPRLPPGTTYNVRRMDPTVFPIISYALISDTASPVALRDLAQYQIVPLLSSIQGLARVNVQGGETAEVEVLADPQRLASYGLSITDVADALSKANVLQAVGQLQDNHKLYLVMADHSINKAAGIGNVVVRADATGIVRLHDVATVQDGIVPQWIRVVEDGKPAVLFNVYEQPDGNAVQIAAAVRTTLAKFKLPADVRMVNWYDQSVLITQSAGSVRDAILIGIVLAALVLMLFLRSWRITLVAMLVVPASLAVSVLVLRMLGMSFNIMTLGGIASAAGPGRDDRDPRARFRAGCSWCHRQCQGPAAIPPRSGRRCRGRSPRFRHACPAKPSTRDRNSRARKLGSICVPSYPAPLPISRQRGSVEPVPFWGCDFACRSFDLVSLPHNREDPYAGRCQKIAVSQQRLVRAPGPRRVQPSCLDAQSGSAEPSLRRAAGDRHLQYLVGAHAL
jgi:multidrug efflux pump subunit AcrB